MDLKISEAKMILLCLSGLIILVGYFFRGFLQEAGKELYTVLIRRRTRIQGGSGQSHSLQTGIVQVDALRTSSVPKSEISPQPVSNPASTPHVPGLTLAHIKAEVNKAPPMQRSHIEGQYVGIRVDWLVYFRSATEGDGKIKVRLCSAEGGMTEILCTVDAGDYPQFRILHEDVQLRVAGIIASWFIGDAVLEDARFTFFP